MGAVIRTTPGKLAGQLKRRNQATLRAVAVGALRGAHRGRAIIVRETPVDQSQLKQSWKVEPGNAALRRGERASMSRLITQILAELRNMAPHAGIVELGARPHPVSPEGIIALADWAKRVLDLSFTDNVSGPVQIKTGGRRQMRKDAREAAALEIAQRIAWKIRKYGQEPTYFVKGSLPLLLQAVEIEVEKAINEVARSGAGKDGA
jgi:hypothetical protein